MQIISQANGPSKSPAYLKSVERGMVVDLREHLERFIKRQLQANERLGMQLEFEPAKQVQLAEDLNAIFLRELQELVTGMVERHTKKGEDDGLGSTAAV